MFDKTPSTENFPNLYQQGALNQANTVGLKDLFVSCNPRQEKSGYCFKTRTADKKKPLTEQENMVSIRPKSLSVSCNPIPN